MPTLEENQRAWLDQALQSKGRFTRAASIRKDWENYRRRRETAATAAALLPATDPRKRLIDQQLQAADQMAEAGRFGGAYKALDQTKKLAKAERPRALLIHADMIRIELNVLQSTIGNLESDADWAPKIYDELFARIGKLRPCSDAADFDEACQLRKSLGEAEEALRVEMAAREGRIASLKSKVTSAQLKTRLSAVANLVKEHEDNGDPDGVRDHAQRLAGLRQRVDGPTDRLYGVSSWDALIGQKRAAFETAFKALKDMSAWAGREQETDARTVEARSGLTPTENLARIEREEAERMRVARQVMVMQGLGDDRRLVRDTGDGRTGRQPEPKRFDGGPVLDGALTRVYPDGELPDDVPLDRADQLVAAAVDAMRDALTRMQPDGGELLDLTLMKPEELARLCGVSLTGLEGGFSESHKALISRMVAELQREIRASSPNRISPDGTQLTVGGVTLQRVGEVGRGANGDIVRFSDGQRSFVVKSMRDTDPSERAKMERELRTHMQLQDGAETEGLSTENLVRTHGAVVGEDGSLSMILEEVEGGDLADANNTLTALNSVGLLSDEARQTVMLDYVVQLAKGIKTMQAVGLVHNDLKPLNAMVSRDGTIKLIDFGESRFVDQDTGMIPTSETGGYDTTPGYEAPEHRNDKTVEGVTTKADTYALSQIAKVLIAPQIRAGTRMKDTTALGRLTSLLDSYKAEDRPSIDMVLVSSLITQIEREQNPDDVKDLKDATAETGMALREVKFTVPSDQTRADLDIQINGPFRAVSILEMRLKGGDAQVRLDLISDAASTYEDMVRDLEGKLAKAPPETQEELREKIAVYRKRQVYWTEKMDALLTATRTEGKAEADRLALDETRTIQVPGEGGGALTPKAAVALRDRRILEVETLWRDYTTLAQEQPDMAAREWDRVDAAIKAAKTQIAAIDGELRKLLGPKGKYYVAEQKLAEVNGRFAPGKSPQTLKSGVTPEENPNPPAPPEVELERDENGIPVPPPMPGETKVEAK